MTEPSGELLNTDLIERYLCVRGRRYFRGQHDGEFFYVANAHPRRLHVHFEISPANPDVFSVRVAPACFFPVADHAVLAQFADTWNAQDREIIAMVHRSSDPKRIGVTAYQSRWFAGRVRFEEFAAFVDGAIDAAIALFGALDPVAELPSAPLLLDAG